jgi:hypothetical protein
MANFKIPGVVWVVLLVALPLLGEWLTQYFPLAQWTAPVAGLLLIIAKIVEVIQANKAMPAGVAMTDLPALGQKAKPTLWWG